MADLTLPTPNKNPGDGAPADDTNLIIEAINTLNSAVENIAEGPQGPQGEPGTPGAAGANASVTVGSTNTGAAGSDAVVTNSGTAQAAVFDFTIPRGETGDTGDTGTTGPQGPAGNDGNDAVISVGTVTTGLPESVVTITNSGSPSSAVFDFSIPRGATGEAANLGNSPGQNLGVASAGSSTSASRQDHVHNIPSASDVGAIATSARGAVNGVASLDAAGKVLSNELPAIAITETYVVASEAAMLALDAQTGDVAIRTDVSLNFILADDPASTLGNWKQLLSPSDVVTSVDGRIGVVTLSDLYDASGLAASAQTAAESYADGLASNYDPVGSASTVAGNLTTHEGLTATVHGISNTANLVYTADSRLSDARTPTAHAASHETGGADALTLAANQVTGTAIVQSIVDAKGDLIAGTGADTVSRIAIGVDGQVLTAASGQVTGVEWTTPVSTPLSSTTPNNIGTAAVGTGTDAARSDHVHAVVSPTAAGSKGARLITMSTSAPSGGADGDVWLVYV